MIVINDQLNYTQVIKSIIIFSLFIPLLSYIPFPFFLYYSLLGLIVLYLKLYLSLHLYHYYMYFSLYLSFFLSPLDLPFLVTKRHTMRRQPVVFLEASIPETNLSIKPINIQDNEEEERDFSSWSPQIVNQPAPTPLFYQKEQYISSYPTPPPRTTTTKGNNNIGAPHNGHHHYHCDTPLTNSALKIHVINNLLSDSFLESTIRHRYLQSPYHLTVDHILVTAGTAYVTFLEGE